MTLRTLIFAMAMVLLLATGCQGPAAGGARSGPAAVATPADDPDLQQAAHTGRLLADQFAAEGQNAAMPPAEILWIDPDIARDRRTAAAMPAPPATPTGTTMAPPKVIVPEPDEPTVTTTKDPAEAKPQITTTAAPVTGPSRQELLDLLLTDLRQSNDPAMQRAIQAATLSVLDPRYTLDDAILQPLPPSRRDAVRQYHDLLKQIHAGLAAGGRGVDRQRLADELFDVLGPMPIDITTLDLCSRVQGFGVYTPFPDHRFIVGRDHRMIVYAELEHFTSQAATSGAGYEVKLTQEIELYDDAGLLVWKQDPVPIVDRSANRRRDFFTVQMIELPARLTVGRFALKLRVIDDATGNRAERSIDIELVADQALVRQ